MKKLIIATAAAAVALTAVPMTPAIAKDRHDRDYRDYRDDRGRDYRNDRSRHRVYDDRGRYVEPRRVSRSDRVWRDRDGKYYCQRENGTTGLLVGAGVGALAGHTVAGRNDKTLGAIIGGVLGGALGREVDRGRVSCR